MPTKRSKRYEDQVDEIDPAQEYDLDSAVDMVLDQATADFDETIECHVRLDVDPTKSDEQIRGSLELPAGTGQDVRVVVFAEGEDAQEAEDAGADEVGADDLIERIQDGWLEFDQSVATPDMMSDLSELGPVLGPRGLMPNNKAGTVTFDVKDAVEKLKRGQVELRTDKYGIIHTKLGTSDMENDEIKENLRAVLKFIVNNRPPGAPARGQYIQSISMSPTMGPSLKVQPAAAWE
ncbi:MAG: 50S ribosomal protein L1 [bacterium]